MTPRVAKKVYETERDTLLNEAIRQSQGGRFMNWLEILWPNARNILLRLANHVIEEYSTETQKLKAMTSVVELARKNVIDAEPEKTPLVGRDRLIFILFLSGALQPFLSSGHKRKGQTKSVSLRMVRNEDGSIEAQKVAVKSKAPSEKGSTESIKQIIETALDHRDKLILGEDIHVLEEVLAQ